MKRAIRDPIVVAIVIAGVVLTAGLATMIRRDNTQAATQWLAERAELIARATEGTVENSFDDLDAVAAFLNTTESMSQELFAQFVEQMDMNPGVIGIGYLRAVDAADIDDFLVEARDDVPGLELLSFDGIGGIGPDYSPRQKYYPLRYVHGGPFLDIVIAETPIDSQVDALGFDLATEPLWFPEFEKAMQLTDPSVSNLVGVGGVFEEQAFGAAHPIYNEDGSLDGVLIAPGLEILLTSDLGVSITSKVTWEIDNHTPDFVETDWPVWRRLVNLSGSTWTLAVAPNEGAIRSLSSNAAWLVALIGVGLTALLATTTHQSQQRRKERAELDQLHRVAADKDRFLATVSHELRTPLTVVVGLSHELADRGEAFADGERATLLAMIGEHSEEAAAIVEDLLVAARSDIDKIAIRNEVFDLQEAVEQALAASSLDDAYIVGDAASAYADPQRVRQILRNLFTNAARYGGPNVEVRFGRGGTEPAVTVADNGSPIESSRRRQIFDPYTSAHESSDQLGSIGLGLFISLKLARLMGGDLRYRHDGTHVLFELFLPTQPAPTRIAESV